LNNGRPISTTRSRDPAQKEEADWAFPVTKNKKQNKKNIEDEQQKATSCGSGSPPKRTFISFQKASQATFETVVEEKRGRPWEATIKTPSKTAEKTAQNEPHVTSAETRETKEHSLHEPSQPPQSHHSQKRKRRDKTRKPESEENVSQSPDKRQKVSKSPSTEPHIEETQTPSPPPETKNETKPAEEKSQSEEKEKTKEQTEKKIQKSE
jgi:hypothetical protein